MTTPPTHGILGCACLALTMNNVAKSLETALTNPSLVQLISNYVAIAAGIASLVWVVVQWVRSNRKK